MAGKSLFRAAAMQACQAKWLGDIVLVRPVTLRLLVCAAAGLALALLAFLSFGSYTRRISVTGQLVPDSGVIKVFAPQSGIVAQRLVLEGQPVTKGQPLYLLSSERRSGTQTEVQAAISGQVALRRQSLDDELAQTRQMQQVEDASLRKKFAGAKAALANLEAQLAGQQGRLGLAEQAMQRTSQLLAQGYISQEMAQQKQADLIDQRSRLQALQRERLNLEQELQAQAAELESLPHRHRSQLAQIERLLASTDQEWTESEARRRLVISAPEGGTATALAAEAGQVFDGSRPLASIVPQGALLQAHLYAPSRAIGFVRPRDQVLLRYQAFPYQKFGHAYGTVLSVSRVALGSGDLAGVQIPAPGAEPLYLVKVALARQTLTAYGQPQALQAGMLVDADILQEKRKLYEWVLEPLYSLSGKL